jgi:hypothetical protein
MLLITTAVWLLAVIALGCWQLFYAWHWGSGAIFLFHTMPLAVLTLVLIAVLETLYWRWRSS